MDILKYQNFGRTVYVFQFKVEKFTECSAGHIVKYKLNNNNKKSVPISLNRVVFESRNDKKPEIDLLLETFGPS